MRTTFTFHTATPALLRELAQEPGPVTSLYLDTYRQGRDTRLGPKQLARFQEDLQGHAHLQETLGEALAAYLQPLTALQEDASAWQTMGEGLALFLTPTKAVAVRLRRDPHPSLTVGGPRLHPLVREQEYTQSFYLLAVAQDSVRLLQGDSWGFKEIVSPHLPLNLEAALPEVRRDRQSKITGRPRGHQVYRGNATTVEQSERFLHLVGQGLQKTLAGREPLPLILATVEEHVKPLQEASGYRHFTQEFINGSHSNSSSSHLHELALPLMVREAARKRLGLGEEVEAATAKKLTLVSLEEIIPLAQEGRVGKLLVGSPSHRESDEIHLAESPLDVALRATLTQGGEVLYNEFYASPHLALLRY